MSSQKKRTITILGSTGSIGTQTLQVLDNLGDAFRVKWLTCNTKVEDLARQVVAVNPYGVAIREEAAFNKFKELLPDFRGHVLCGEEGLCEAAADSENDVVMSAMVGFSGVVPTMAAVKAGHVIGLANKEALVSAGCIVQGAIVQYGATLIAVDSEHSAIVQCMMGEQQTAISRFIITASGGPFRTFNTEQLQHVTAKDALMHPNWSMGNKITIDSSTLMNKGFEVIEAHWLFGIDPQKISVVIHPQSIIHSMVEFVDGTLKAQLSVPSMLPPIQFALTYPERMPLNLPKLDFEKIASLTFEKPDTDKFPCLRLAFEALETGGTAGCVLNSANEFAVQAFLQGAIPFLEIPRIIESAMENMEYSANPSLADLVQLDQETRNRLASKWQKSLAPHFHS